MLPPNDIDIFINFTLVLKQFILLFFSTLIFSSQTKAQYISPSILNTVGGSVLSGNTVYEFNIGEMVLVNSSFQSTFIVTQGLLQPRDRDVQYKPAPTISNDELAVYPVPTFDYISLKPNFYSSGKMEFYLTNSLGQFIFLQEYYLQSNDIIRLDLTQIAVGTYYLKVFYTSDLNAQTTQVQTYKLQKI
jgi:hypothetical protein